MKVPNDRLFIPAVLFTPLYKYLPCYTQKSKKSGTKLPKSTVLLSFTHYWKLTPWSVDAIIS